MPLSALATVATIAKCGRFLSTLTACNIQADIALIRPMRAG